MFLIGARLLPDALKLNDRTACHGRPLGGGGKTDSCPPPEKNGGNAPLKIVFEFFP